MGLEHMRRDIRAPEREGTRARARGGNTAMSGRGREGVRDGRSPRREL